MVLRDPQEVALFKSLHEKGLVSGEFYTTSSGENGAAVHGLTPDGRALLALQDYVSECSSGQQRSMFSQTQLQL